VARRAWLGELGFLMASFMRGARARYLDYFAWKRAGNLPAAFQRKFSFINTHAKCRLCRWAYARKFGFRWNQREQRPDPETLLESTTRPEPI
jgi:hypothetical protein